jgi:hypothetical protein
LNHQISLAEAVTRLAKGIQMKMRDLERRRRKAKAMALFLGL